MSWVDLFPIVARIDALQARVDRLESFQLQTLATDRVLDGVEPNPGDNTDVIIATVGLAVGDYQGGAHLTFELSGSAAATRLVTAWIGGVGGAVITGPSSAQVTLHQQLAYAHLSIGPVRVQVSGAPGNAVLYVRVTPIGSGPVGHVIIKANTSLAPGLATAHPQASGVIAR